MLSLYHVPAPQFTGKSVVEAITTVSMFAQFSGKVLNVLSTTFKTAESLTRLPSILAA